MINLEQRDIALVNFPFSNQIQVKFRPVVIISNVALVIFEKVKERINKLIS